MSRLVPVTVSVLALASAATLAATTALAASPGRPVAGTSCRVFPKNNYWHADVSRLPVNPRSRQWLSHMSTGRDLHPDFGPSYGDGPNYDMPVTVVRGSHPKVPVRFTYAAESDHVRYPFGSDTRIEGGRGSAGDKHAIVVDRTHCRLYETWNTTVRNGSWHAGSGATWSLTSNKLRPDGWTSADAAGLPILPGLLRWNEVRSGSVDHAIRFTTDVTSRHHLWPARHDAGSTDRRSYPPMGARFRLKQSFSSKGYGADAKVVIAAMKRYGLVLADNGSPWYFQGERNAHWPDRLIADLKRIPASAFVAVDASSLKRSSGSAAVNPG
ncbi:MAG: hypothetical protein ACXVXB_10315 [Nocardioidaceae bacterium]